MITFVSKSYSQKLTFFSKENSSLYGDDIWSITIDNKGVKWLGIANVGLTKFNDEALYTFNDKNSKIKGNIINVLYSDSNNNIWASFSNPNGFIRYNGKEWKVFSANEIKLKSLLITSMVEDGKGNIYCSDLYGVTKFDGKQWKRISLPVSIINIIRSIDINEENNIAIGHDNGLLLFKEGKWISFTKENSELQSSVYSVKFIGNKLFIGYGGNIKGGFSILNEGTWVNYNKENSNLPDNLIRDIEIDNKGNIWMASNNGLIKVNIEDNKIKSYFFRTRSSAIMDIAIKGNNIWVATLYGLFKLIDD